MGRVRATNGMVAWVAAVALAAAVVSGCGSDDGEDAASGEAGSGSSAKTTEVAGVAIAVDEAAAEKLPAEFESGIQFVTSAPYPPYEVFGADKKLEGLDIDTGDAIAATLGVESSWTSVPYDSLVPGLQSGKYDVGLADTSVSETRLEVLDMVTYFAEGLVVVVPKGNPKGIEGMQSMCGKTLLIEQGIDLFNAGVTQTQELCREGGKPEPDVVRLPNQTSLLLGLSSSRGDGAVMAIAAARIAVEEQADKYDLVVPEGMPQGYAPRNVAASMAKNNKGLTAAVQAALESLMQSGKLEQLFAKYELEDLLTEVELNTVREPVVFPPGTTPE